MPPPPAPTPLPELAARHVHDLRLTAVEAMRDTTALFLRMIVTTLRWAPSFVFLMTVLLGVNALLRPEVFLTGIGRLLSGVVNLIPNYLDFAFRRLALRMEEQGPAVAFFLHMMGYDSVTPSSTGPAANQTQVQVIMVPMPAPAPPPPPPSGGSLLAAGLLEYAGAGLVGVAMLVFHFAVQHG